MKYLDYSYPDPASNLALDEALLESAENGTWGEMLRIWESPVYFAVLGYSSRWKMEVNPGASIPVLRRKSGGQTVLQGPGCLNFTLILKASDKSGIQSDTRAVMEKNLRAAAGWPLPASPEIQGISDLVCGGKKFSGNAMRRGKSFYLFHGTFLYSFDLLKIAECLGAPEREPEYRKKRSHLDFLMNIPAEKNLIVDSLRREWQAREEISNLPEMEVKRLKSEFYGCESWNLKY